MASVLQVQSLHGSTILLRLHDALTSRAEVIHLYPHPTLSESHQTRLGTNGPNIGTGKIILLADELIQVHVVTEGHLRGMQGENLLLGGFCEVGSAKMFEFTQSKYTHGQGSRRESYGRYDQAESERDQAFQSCWWP